MSKYTTEVRFICETANDLDESKDYKSIDEIITGAIPKVFDFDFPIFDETYRSVLERKILKHFYTREIGEETVGLWKLRLDTKLNEIMPYYNKLYTSELLEFNPLYTVNLTRDKKTDFDSTKNGEENINDSENKSTGGSDVLETSNTNTINGSVTSSGTSSSTGSGTGTNTNDSTDKYSDTPQGALTNVENGTYLTNARIKNDSATSTSSSTNSSNTSGSVSEERSDNALGTNTTSYGKTEENTKQRSRDTVDSVLSTEDYLEHVVGYEGVNASKMLKEYRETFLNIDMEIINELEVLFMQLW